MDELDQLALDLGEQVATILRRYYPVLLGLGHEEAVMALGVDLAFDVDNPLIQEIIHELATLVRNVGDTTRDEIRALVSRQAAEGWDIDTLAARIAELGEIHTQGRARRIARTETAMAYTRGSMLAYERSGVVKGLEWLLGPNSCDICRDIVARTPKVRFGERFLYDIPHPPAHPNCTCAVAPLLEWPEDE